MRCEFSVVNADGTVVETRKHLVEQLRKEAAEGTVRVRLYRGPEEVGSEAFYTLSDGSVLHEVVGEAGDGSPYSYLNLVVDEPEANGPAFSRRSYFLRKELTP